MLIYGRNAVAETLRYRPESVKKIFSAGAVSDDIKAADGAKVEAVGREFFTGRLGKVKHQWIAAEISPVAPLDISYLEEHKDGQGVYILLDSVQDPGNLGSVIRTARGMGLSGLILTGDRTCDITPAVYSASAGFVNAIDIIVMKNPANNVKRLKQAGFWFLSVDMDGDLILGRDKTDFPLPIVICMGSEGRGVRQTFTKLSDFRAKIPQREGFDSYNLSVASAIVMWEVAGRRGPGAL